MAAPTFVAEYESAWNTSTTPKTASVTVNTGDVLVVGALSESSNTTNTPTGGGLTYTLAQNIEVSQYTSVYVWTAVAASSQTFTLSLANAGGQQWGFNCVRFSSSDGVGASSKTNVASGAPSLALTTGGANSAIVCFNGDWNAGSGARTWRTINSITPTSGNGLEVTYQATGNYTIYAAYWTDAGAAGSKTTGLSAPTGQKYAIVAVEVLGSSGSADATVTPATIAVTTSLPAATASAGSTPTPATVATTAALPAVAARAGSTATPATVAATTTLPAATLSAGSTVTPAPVAAVAALPAVAVSAGGSATATPATVTAVAALPAATPSAGSTVTAATLTSTTALPAATVAASSAAAPATIAAIAAVPLVNLVAASTVLPATITATVSLPLVSVNGAVRNLDITVGAPDLKWHTYTPTSGWNAGSPQPRWQTGNPTT